MIKLIISTIKLSIFAIIVLLLSQIEVGDRRISEHVSRLIGSDFVQNSLHWVSNKFDLVEGHNMRRVKKNSYKNMISPSDSDESTETNHDQSTLSGLLKRK